MLPEKKSREGVQQFEDNMMQAALHLDQKIELNIRDFQEERSDSDSCNNNNSHNNYSSNDDSFRQTDNYTLYVFSRQI